MILINYYALIYPSPSLSASSIIYCSYSSVITYPSSLATLRKFLKEILPVPSSSKSLKALRIYYLGSLSAIFALMRSAKSEYLITPFPY